MNTVHTEKALLYENFSPNKWAREKLLGFYFFKHNDLK